MATAQAPSSVRALVTGASGFFGTRLVRSLLQHGQQVTALCYPDASGLPESPNLQVVVGDVRDPSVLKEAVQPRPECVYHLAGTLATESERQPWMAIEVNLLASLRLLELLKARPVRFVFASSVAVYGSTVNAPVSEKTITLPDSYYGITKASVEQWGLFQRRHSGMDFRALRLGVIVAAGQNPARPSSTAFFSVAIERAARGMAVEIPVGLDTTLPLLYWRDALAALLRAGTAPTAESAIYNVSWAMASAGDLVETLQRYLPQSQISVSPDPELEAAASVWRNLRMDCTRARRELGWSAAYDLDSMVADMMREVSTSA